MAQPVLVNGRRDGSASVDASGRRISFEVHGPVDASGVVLIHGGAAHRGWWQDVVPGLAEDHRVATFDLSGHGQSSHAEWYGWDQWAAEVMAVIEAAGMTERPIVVGHSMGGVVGLRAAARYGRRLRGLVVVDSAIRDYTDEELEPFLRHVDTRVGVYESREAALARFRLMPDAPRAAEPLVERIKAAAVRPIGDGWGWHFDPRTFRASMMTPSELLPVRCPVALVRGDRGSMPLEICDDIRERIDQDCPTFVIADAGHHVMIEQPERFLGCLRDIAANWQSSGEAID